ncbi:MAG: hypothetical protein ACLGI3_13655, partial [Actinomycetes bacterium]
MRARDRPAARPPHRRRRTFKAIERWLAVPPFLVALVVWAPNADDGVLGLLLTGASVVSLGVATGVLLSSSVRIEGAAVTVGNGLRTHRFRADEVVDVIPVGTVWTVTRRAIRLRGGRTVPAVAFFDGPAA